MRILVLGAGGFIGRHIMSSLLAEGHQVVAGVRQRGHLPLAFPSAEFVEIDLARATSAADWLPHVTGVDCIVNAAGVLKGASMDAVHVDGPRALAEAARKAGVGHMILLSAISAREDVRTDYSLSKLAGEDVVRQSGLNWTILRPSLVYADGSYGGTSLMRGMAGLPLLTPIPGRGDYGFTPIHARDLARAITNICGNAQFFGRDLELSGLDTLTLTDLLRSYRHWLGFGEPRFVSVPLPMMRAMGRVGDLAGDGPISTNSLDQMIAGNACDGQAFAKDIGFAPRSLQTALLEHPAQVQDRWHARLFFLAPAIQAVLVLLWLASAWLGFFHGDAATRELVAALHLPQSWADPLRVGSSLLDIVVALIVLLDRRGTWATLVQLAVVGGYTLVIGFALPQLWTDPLGPLLKNLPILALIGVHGAIAEKR